MARLLMASLVTLSLIAGMVASVVLAAMVASDQVSLTAAIAITVGFNILLWLVSPWFTDLSLRWLNSMAFLDDATVAERYPAMHRLIVRVASEHGFKAPRIGLIRDRNPTAFTYGRGRSNARIILTEGIFEFLSEEEVDAVVAHELGHIVHRDFIVMTMAGMLVQILYQIYTALTRSRGDSKSKLAWVGLMALVFYYIGEYLLLYLSRTREYLADSFSARYVEPRHLASALVKVAYGIVKAEDTEASDQLLRSTRHLGLIDVNTARALGLMAGGTVGVREAAARPGSEAAGAIPADVLLFDCYNPWAGLAEFNSTHPLTGRRILALAGIASAKGQPFAVDVAAAAKAAGVSRGGLRGRFLKEALIFVLPVLVASAAVLAGFWPLALAAAAAALLATLPLRYPFRAAAPATVRALMGDPTMSPLIGRPVRLEGSPIGRGDPGFFASEDVLFQDPTGHTLVDFRSMLGFLGDWWAGYSRVPPHLGQPGEVIGWFRRSTAGHLVLSRMTTGAGQLRARPYACQAVLALAVIGVTGVVIAKTGPRSVYQPVPYGQIWSLATGTAR